jgi:hypothetical protein
MGSKNNPNNRAEKAAEIQYNGKPVTPVRFIGKTSSYIAAAYKDGGLAINQEGIPVAWDALN